MKMHKLWSVKIINIDAFTVELRNFRGCSYGPACQKEHTEIKRALNYWYFKLIRVVSQT
jgi:hypothetical protein